MKKVLSILTVALFLVAFVAPTFAQDPPKDKQKTECPKKKDGTACSKADSTKCAKHQKAGCCKGDKKACDKK